jgi:hypothetical protein
VISANRLTIVLIVMVLAAGTALAHPGAAIAVSKEGIVYFVDTGAGVFSPAFDPDGRFRTTRGH